MHLACRIATAGWKPATESGKMPNFRNAAQARMHQDDKFDLRVFHDFVWKNGNVPIALHEWEYFRSSG
jgi:hypothetical protein